MQAALNSLGAHRLRCLLCSGTAELVKAMCSTAADALPPAAQSAPLI